ncbi:hypothetical protein CHS0354_014653 [Potamilus streckersoni]|uniref:Pre-mRNA-splicing factor SLU7 n=1 Tax=Potamilus streckersoni TaxID=2493646 RepID=A0AAE0SQ15_9BIVA|nr:hypothetical protein CHS0354_014653 [Potamilus streckersoni]
MSFHLNLPPSVVAKQVKSEQEKEPQRQSREDWRKMKELEEARKAGTAPAMQDEEGKDINPHIPQYIMQAPWYFGTTTPTLKHQRPQEEKQKSYSKMEEWFKRGVKQGSVATKFRKGACENCGAVTHTKKDCLERPRKVGAKFSGENFAPDEYIQKNLSFDYEGKRDRWNGYNVEDHHTVMEEYAHIEAAKRMLKEQKLEQVMINSDVKEEDNPKVVLGDDGDDDKYADDLDMPGQKFETKQRITVRNLRIREDTAKYLYNLDPNSAYYDPKTRSMRDNPLKGTPKEGSEWKYQGDNFVRFSGDAQQFAKKQVFAWEAYEYGTDIHVQADPTKLELLTREVEKRKDESKTTAKQSILDKYGGQEYLEAPPKQLLLAQTENYVEYSRHGTVIKGEEKPVIRSKYEEDVYINNHTCVWGSYWNNGQWGYKCCHSLIKESYCTGEAGKDVAEAGHSLLKAISHGQAQEEVEDEGMEPPKSLLEQQHQEKLVERKIAKKNKKKKSKHKKKQKRRKSSSSSCEEESESDMDEEKEKARRLKKAITKELEHQRRANELLVMDERKCPYNSMYEVQAPTEEEMEAYRLKRQRMEDPLANLI